ncbi:GNAT family N-acetyltransferase [Micrococcales bacterium 31B]|nr:GNAT family N-acetyltransferase [Micrococcales bacterium 31B]
MFLSPSPVRALRPDHIPAALAICAQNPVLHVLPAARLEEVGSHISREFLGYFEDGELRALCWAGANLTPVQATERALEAFTKVCIKSGRRSTSIVGEASAVRFMWERLERHWTTPLECRWSQPMLLASAPYAGAVDRGVRTPDPAEVDDLFHAFVSMFIEEVGYSPVAADGGAYYRERVRSMMRARRSFVRSAPGSGVVDFKAEVGALANGVAQIHGVWVRPDARGQGLATRCLGAVLNLCLGMHAPHVTLYVNDYNLPARKLYAKLGFAQVEEFATILF